MENSVKLKFHTKEVTKAMDDAASKRMLEAVNEVRNTVLDTLSGPRTGRTYYVPGTKRKYTASSPGEPPATATAQLRQNIKVKVEGDGRKVVGYVGTDKIQGLMTEIGTIHMAPRPWLGISFKKSLDKVKSILGRQWFR